MTEPEELAPPVGEEIHLPAPTIIPFVTAIAITLTIIGTTITWYLTVVGAILLIVCIVLWVRDTRRDVAQLPEQHTHP
jgi:hypothetical protein